MTKEHNCGPHSQSASRNAIVCRNIDILCLPDLAVQLQSVVTVRAEAGRRALNVWLRNNSDEEHAELLRKACITLHAPAGTGDYRYTRAQLRDALLQNFRASNRWINEAPKEHRALVQNALAARCAPLCFCGCSCSHSDSYVYLIQFHA